MQSHVLDTAFWRAGPPLLPGPANTPPGCGTDAITNGACCEQQVRIPLPVPSVPPVAGNVTVSLHGVPLAMLLSPDYAEIDTATWSPGDALGVSAAGGEVAAFSGTLVTPSMITGLSPALGQAPVTIAHDADFRISWTPEAKDGELMQLQIDSIESGGARVVLCAVLDTAGSVVVDASLLGPLAGAQSASIHFTRSITSNVSVSNANVALEGDLWLSSLATIQ
jgi:hypothetical protein